MIFFWGLHVLWRALEEPRVQHEDHELTHEVKSDGRWITVKPIGWACGKRLFVDRYGNRYTKSDEFVRVRK